MEKRQEVNQNGRKKLGNKGFSLVELIVVIAIMAILTVVIAPQFMRYIEKSRESVDKQTIESIKSSIEAGLADEAAWDSVTGKVEINFDNNGNFNNNGANDDRVYNPSTFTAFNTEVNSNLNKTVSFKSKKYKDGVTFTVAADTKEISYKANASSNNNNNPSQEQQPEGN